MSNYVKWAQKQHGFGTRIVVTLLAGMLFVILIPYTIIVFCPALDRLLGLPSIKVGAVNLIIGGIMLVVGLFFGFWSNFMEVGQGRGTPLPIMPTQELLVKGPFRYCRNPMTFGAILAYLGIGVSVGTIAGIVLVLCFGALMMFYLKRFEERELAERFGEAYLQYRQEVPFIIPRFPIKQKS
jgi:protein-S-isoprenylcysteine O-methyltransferase Ste14